VFALPTVEGWTIAPRDVDFEPFEPGFAWTGVFLLANLAAFLDL